MGEAAADICVASLRVGSSILVSVALSLTFQELVREGRLEPVEGWDFSWLDERATEERPSWGYARMIVQRLASANAALDIQTGGGEVLAEVLAKVRNHPGTVAATESWKPNLAVARRLLGPFNATVLECADDADLPFPDESFDLVISRHPTVVLWNEIARVLRPSGTYLSQQIGPGSNRELTDFMMGPQPISQLRSTERAARDAEAAGLDVVDLRQEALRIAFNDVAAVIYFLRKVVWTVPGFTVEGYRDQLARLHARIESEGPFIAYSQRFLVEAHKLT
jgi:SAM-dependent methyltransferase